MTDPTVAELLEFESNWPAHTGMKAAAIATHFGIRTPRYYQILHRVVTTREALQCDAMTTFRVQRQLAENVTKRTERRFR